ncbi:MAG: hypothetical protein LBG58_13045 [Planctomycetaceae bacterium]|jgi:hypothetical protein|nr:hypothetical protein [Planctomycetaceae bacterium]
MFPESFAQDRLDDSICFRKEIPKDKAAMMLTRIIHFGDLLQSNNHSTLKYLWNNPFDQIEFDGNFSISYSNLDYLNVNPGLPRKYGKGDVSITLSHWAGKNYEDYGPYISQNYLVLCFLNYTKIGSYYEFGKIVNESFGVRFNENSGLSEIFQLSLKGTNVNIPAEDALLEWNHDGKIIVNQNAVIIPRMRNLPDIEKTDEIKTQWGQVPVIPQIKNDKDLKNFFERMTQIMSARKLKEVLNLLELQLVQPATYKSCLLSFREWKCQWGGVIGNIKNELQGYVFDTKTNGLLDLYIEGMVSLPDKFDIKPYLAGNGIEVRFHPTGYPASYKTIVRNRLFGRQIEWNDKGEVISDIDFDIPKPWLDAPKNDENPQSKN